MSRETKEERTARRVENVLSWLEVIEEAARELEADVLSRSSETASEAGADPDPKLRPCEHRREWFRGGLCLACDNTGLRRATQQEREAGLAYDPYFVNPLRGNYTAPPDESTSGRRAREAERIDRVIAELRRDARIRAGAEVHEGALRAVRYIEGAQRALGRMGRKVLREIERLSPELQHRVMARDPAALRLLAEAVPGRLWAPTGRA